MACVPLCERPVTAPTPPTPCGEPISIGAATMTACGAPIPDPAAATPIYGPHAQIPTTATDPAETTHDLANGTRVDLLESLFSANGLPAAEFGEFATLALLALAITLCGLMAASSGVVAFMLAHASVRE